MIASLSACSIAFNLGGIRSKTLPNYAFYRHRLAECWLPDTELEVVSLTS
jgi:hypothetical protein